MTDTAQQISSIQPGRLLRRDEVEHIVGLKRSAIYDRIEKGDFPKQVRLHNSRTVRWRSDDIKKWFEDQVQA